MWSLEPINILTLTKNKMKKEYNRERCKGCGCFLSFAMGQEGDGDFVCNNPKCKSNTDDYRVNYNVKIDYMDNQEDIEFTIDRMNLDDVWNVIEILVHKAGGEVKYWGDNVYITFKKNENLKPV